MTDAHLPATDAALLARLQALGCQPAPERLAGLLAAHRELAEMAQAIGSYLADQCMSVELEPAPVFTLAAVLAADRPC